MADGLACDLHWTWGRRMDRVWFRDWASNIDELTAAQRREATAVLSGPPEGEASLAAIELGINEERRCPHSDSGGATAKAETAKARARVEHQSKTPGTSLRKTEGPGAGGASVPDHQAGVRLRQGSPSRSGEERAAACTASGLLEPDDCPAAPVVTGEKRVRNLPNRPCGD